MSVSFGARRQVVQIDARGLWPGRFDERIHAARQAHIRQRFLLLLGPSKKVFFHVGWFSEINSKIVV